MLPEYFEIAAFVERHGNESKKAYPNVAVYRSCEELFADDSVDLVIINTPSPSHYSYALAALHANKHVVIDKPFTATVKEAETLIELATKKNLVLTVFHNRRWEGELIALKKIIDIGLLGKLIDGEFRFERYKTAPNPKSHKEEPLPGNGLIYELCTHLIDQAIFLFGMPDAVFADICKQRPFSKIDDYCSLILYYGSRFKLSIKSSLLVAHQGPSYIINGHTGSFVKYRANIQEERLSAGMLPSDPDFAVENADTAATLTVLQNDGSLKTEKYHSPAISYTGFYRQLGEALQGKDSIPVEPLDALKGIKIIEAAYKSVVERKVIEIK
jgi:predicted dehydrogenase